MTLKLLSNRVQSFLPDSPPKCTAAGVASHVQELIGELVQEAPHGTRGEALAGPHGAPLRRAYLRPADQLLPLRATHAACGGRVGEGRPGTEEAPISVRSCPGRHAENPETLRSSAALLGPIGKVGP